MPKKVTSGNRPDKRAKRKVVARPTTVSPAQPSATIPAPAVSATPVRSGWSQPTRVAGRAAGTIRDEDYRYIYSDLRRIGILAGSIFVVLIALTFVLR